MIQYKSISSESIDTITLDAFFHESCDVYSSRHFKNTFENLKDSIILNIKLIGKNDQSVFNVEKIIIQDKMYFYYIISNSGELITVFYKEYFENIQALSEVQIVNHEGICISILFTILD